MIPIGWKSSHYTISAFILVCTHSLWSDFRSCNFVAVIKNHRLNVRNDGQMLKMTFRNCLYYHSQSRGSGLKGLNIIVQISSLSKIFYTFLVTLLPRLEKNFQKLFSSMFSSQKFSGKRFHCQWSKSPMGYRSTHYIFSVFITIYPLALISFQTL